MVTSDFRPEVEIQSFRAFAMHPSIIGTVRSLWTFKGQIPRFTERISSYYYRNLMINNDSCYCYC